MPNTAFTKTQLTNSYLSLPSELHSPCFPQPAPEPKIALFNHQLAEELGISSQNEQLDELTLVLSGSSTIPDSHPTALAYAGHQYGHFTMLGDGRAILLTEVTNNSGLSVDIQLKGSGRTPYSRNGDGRAALGPMIREYIVSEAMHALGIPTTRSLAVVTTGEQVARESMQQGAVLTRVAASHLRVGTFELAARLPDPSAIKHLADYALKRHFSELIDAPNPYLGMLKEIIQRQAQLIAQWMKVGFVHGVMNTDNMAISGETIDFGPCAFLDTYEYNKTYSSIDRHGRYAYGNQAVIAQWNLARLAETLLPLLHTDTDSALALANEELVAFGSKFKTSWNLAFAQKIGLHQCMEGDDELVNNLLSILEENQFDFTNSFAALSAALVPLPDTEAPTNPLHLHPAFLKWRSKWIIRLEKESNSPGSCIQLMQRANPLVIPRNHRIQQAISTAEQGDFSLALQMNEVLHNPFAYKQGTEDYLREPLAHELVCKTFCGT
jgi:serine/tyrosine/threonine adenylyltransferase